MIKKESVTSNVKNDPTAVSSLFTMRRNYPSGMSAEKGKSTMRKQSTLMNLSPKSIVN